VMVGFPPRWPPRPPAPRLPPRKVRAEQALRRFHFELIRFYVADAKRLVGEATWSELLGARPRILEGAVPGLVIQEAELGEATLPPLFGRAADRPTTEAARRRRAWLKHLLDLKLWPAPTPDRRLTPQGWRPPRSAWSRRRGWPTGLPDTSGYAAGRRSGGPRRTTVAGGGAPGLQSADVTERARVAEQKGDLCARGTRTQGRVGAAGVLACVSAHACRGAAPLPPTAC